MKLNKNKNIMIVISAVFIFLAMIDGWLYGFFYIASLGRFWNNSLSILVSV